MEWAIFNDESADYTAEESVEAGFYSREEAEAALAERYTDEDDCFVHAVEEAAEDEYDDEAEEDMRRHEENEAAAILDSMHRYGWVYE